MTGITGLVGAAFVTELFRYRKDVHIIALVRGRGPAGAQERVNAVIKEQCEFDGQGCDPDEILKKIKVIQHEAPAPFTEEIFKEIEGVDTFFHCAADVNLGKDVDGSTYNCNFGGTKVMIEAAKRLKVKHFHFVSTAYVAGKAQGVVKEDGLIPDNEFNNPYERSKYDAEALLRNSGLNFNIYRPSIIIGRLSDGKIRKALAFYRICDFMAKIKKLQSSKMGKKATDEIDLPIRLEAAHISKCVYFVPVDYVQKSITAIFLTGIHNKTYHITGQGPASVVDIETVLSTCLKIKGFSVVKKIENPSALERLMHKYIGDLLPYATSEMFFDISNVLEVMGDSDLKWEICYDSLLLIFGAYFKEKFPELYI